MNSKEVIQEIRTLLGFSEEKTEEVKMETATLVDGTIIEWEGELAVGTAIFVQTGEGLIPAPDATHEVEGGMLVTTEGGIVTEIVEIEEEVEVEVAATEFATVESFNSLLDKFNEVVARLEAIEKKNVEQEAKFNSMKDIFSKTVDLVEKVADLPSEEPTKAPAKLSKKEEQFANIMKIAQTLKNK
jgi:preprotein translocase subunit YajC